MRKLIAFVAVLAGLVAAPVMAAELQAPKGDVILTVTGLITNTTSEGKAEFDLESLEALGVRETSTETPWHEGKKTFAGPLGSDFLAAVGATGKTLFVTALNDYTTEIPVEDFAKYPVILATRVDGEPMRIRDKGPVFVIYPFDEFPELQSQAIYARSAWQVKTIEVR